MTASGTAQSAGIVLRISDKVLRKADNSPEMTGGWEVHSFVFSMLARHKSREVTALSYIGIPGKLAI